MNLRRLLPPLAFGLVLLVASEARAMRFWWFDITRDGKPTFSGGIGASDRTPPRVVLGGLHRARIQLSRDSVITPEERARGDITLEGEIEFSFPDLPPMKLDRIRLLHVPEPRRPNQKDGYRDWRLHPGDVEAILAHYAENAPIVIGGGAGSQSCGTAPAEEPFGYLLWIAILVPAFAGAWLWARSWSRRRAAG